MKTLLFAALAALGFGTTAAQACPDFNTLAAEAYQATGAQLRQRRSFPVIAGGGNYVWNCNNVQPGTDQGAGYFTSQPDFSFDLTGMTGLRLVISAVAAGSCDSALLINTSSATWFYDDDDNGGRNPRIVLTRPADGRIDIWMGTYDGEYCNATLQIETFAR